MITSTGKPTKAEQARFNRMKDDADCMACRQRGLKSNFIEIHHHLSGGRRIGHHATVSLCLWHHRGEPLREYGYNTRKATREVYGPSVADGSKLFEPVFGTDAEMLAMQNAVLAGEA